MIEPIYDEALALRLAGSQKDLAETLLKGLTQTLPENIAKIQDALAKEDRSTLTELIHRLHGLICYCGVPRLKTAAKALESALKKNNFIPVDQISDFLKEVESFLDFISKKRG